LPGSRSATLLFGHGVNQTGKATAVWPAVVLAVFFSHTGQPSVRLFGGRLDFGVDLQRCQMTSSPFSVVFEPALRRSQHALPKVKFPERFQLSDVVTSAMQHGSCIQHVTSLFAKHRLCLQLCIGFATGS